MTSPFVRRAAAVFATLTLLSLIVMAQSLVPDDTLATEPIAYSGEIGEPVDAERFTVRVERVRIAETAVDEDGLGSSGPIEAKGVWLVATAEITSATAPLLHIDAALVMGDGYVYSANRWLSNDMAGGTGTTLDPGIPVTGALAFEVPKKRLKDPTLQVSARQSIDGRLSARADVDLGLSGSELDRRLAQPEDRVVVPSPTETS
ncbi:DUF4352 domain-containing protein [Streptomonospora litoralis]|uniref:DUF4352 domain-containing protein n=1 Tax=Streptomonospora litoralis TaxID=2498135 RepID=A0A4P6PV08_9ACTN|nr:DUF4352 domain-containing protein [Streptomonospora litoralis]QBI51933.1 hypothetical protein EKD16_00560 [Streptomonospora litoralis]